MKNRIRIKIRQGGSAVYLLKHHGKVIYVGQSRRVLTRFAGHLEKDFDEVVILWTPIKDLLNKEKALIARYRPKLNADYLLLMNPFSLGDTVILSEQGIKLYTRSPRHREGIVKRIIRKGNSVDIQWQGRKSIGRGYHHAYVQIIKKHQA